MWMMWEEHKMKLPNGECEELLSVALLLQWELLLFIVSHVIYTCLGSWWEVLKVIMENNKKFMEVILHFTFIKHQVNLIYSFKDSLFLRE